MKTRFYNSRIAPLNENDEILKGALHVEGDIITFLGSEDEEKEYLKEHKDLKFDKEIDCQNDLLLPGFKNAHTHSAMTFVRSYADDLSLQDWLYNKIIPLEANLDIEGQYNLSKLAILEYLTSGITANFDMYIDNVAHAKASVDLGYRSVFGGSMNDFGGTVEGTLEEYETINEMADLVSAKLCFHAEYTTKRELIEGLAKLCNDMKEPMFLHIAETKREVEECKERYGMSPFEFIDSLGGFEYGGGGFHGVWMSDNDIEICKNKNVAIVSNPCSNLKLASGIADLNKLEKNGVLIGLGTDGPASNNALDMFREMYLASTLQKVKYMDAAVMDAKSILRMATCNGARIMGLNDCDCLAVGKKADIIRINMKRPSMQPENDILKNIVYAGSKDCIYMTMVDGNILYEDGKFYLNEDVDEIYKKAEESANKLKNA